ncbi:MAG TPA: hypothetical protein VFO28_00830 [Burkholderiaceae bacterium]|nr:hypothetical protein [Burkholderiaceae bacterium]
MNHHIHRIDDGRHPIEPRDDLRDQVKADASRLRNEAFADFVIGADALIRDAAQRTARAANRLAARLHQHAKQRAFEA